MLSIRSPVGFSQKKKKKRSPVAFEFLSHRTDCQEFNPSFWKN